MVTLFLLFLFIQASLAEDKYISVNNGGTKGDWGSTQVCPEDSRATGFQLKVDRSLFDNTGVNAINLLCTDSSGNVVQVISSSTGDFGKMGTEHKCKLGEHLESFLLRVGHHIGVANVKFECSDGTILEGDGTDDGDYGSWSGRCSNGIKGIQTRVEEYQGVFEDDTSVNDARMLCAAYNIFKG